MESDLFPNEATQLVFYDKDVMLLFQWVSTITGVEISSYSDFADGIILYRLMRWLKPDIIPAKTIYSLRPLERLQLIISTISVQFHLETNLTAHDVYNQLRFQDFQVLLLFLKLSCKETTYQHILSFTDVNTQHCPVTSVRTAEVKRKPDSRTPNVSRVKAHREDEVKRSYGFCSPRWSEVLMEELHTRSSVEENKKKVNEDVYDRDTERVTKYDEEIAKVFEDDQHFAPESSCQKKVSSSHRGANLTQIIQAQSRSPTGKYF